jgi:seryl-tRNA synthetase
MQNPGVENWEERVGERVVCPKPGCGKPGILALDTFRAKGRVYTYLVVRHYEGDKVRRCVIKRITEPAKHAKPEEAAKPAKPEEAEEAEVAQLRQRVAELERENERLRSQLAQAQAQVEQLRVALVNAFNARIAQAGPREREALRLKFIAKKGGLSPEVSETAVSLIHALVREDWVAVRLSDFEALGALLV